jgi:hypothetical protein
LNILSHVRVEEESVRQAVRDNLNFKHS